MRVQHTAHRIGRRGASLHAEFPPALRPIRWCAGWFGEGEPECLCRAACVPSASLPATVHGGS
jgi:hypothetical protein